MRKIAYLLMSLSGVIALPAWAGDEQRLAVADNGFAFNLLREINTEKPAENIFISPYSAATALQMVEGGAAGQTRTEMQLVLGTGGFPDAGIGPAAHAVATSLNTGNTNVILTTANAVWFQKGFEVNADFVAATRNAFDATFDPLEFADPGSAEVINQWASDQTHGRINHIADGMTDADTRLFLANAVYFKGKWADPFEAGDTQNHPFHLRSGGETQVPMMSKEKVFTYRKGTGYQAVRLPYQDENLAMYVFLPDMTSSPEQLLGILNGDRWQRVTKPGFKEARGSLLLPKFKFETTTMLNKPLAKLGMKRAFGSDTANFSGIGTNLYISAVLQKAFVEVKEEGTEAAAVTGVVVVTSLAMPMPEPDVFHMDVDRPFVFLIEDNQTGVILFMGVVYEPKAE